jgi:hypothetical protein
LRRRRCPQGKSIVSRTGPLFQGQGRCARHAGVVSLSIRRQCPRSGGGILEAGTSPLRQERHPQGGGVVSKAEATSLVARHLCPRHYFEVGAAILEAEPLCQRQGHRTQGEGFALRLASSSLMWQPRPQGGAVVLKPRLSF